MRLAGVAIPTVTELAASLSTSREWDPLREDRGYLEAGGDS